MASLLRLKSKFRDRSSQGLGEPLNAGIQLSEEGVPANSPGGSPFADWEPTARTESTGPTGRTETGRASSDPLVDAINADDYERVRSILERDQVKVNEKERGGLAFAAIHHAATNGNEGMMSLLVNWPGIDLNAEDGVGRTAMIIACKEGHAGIVSMLLEKGADVLKYARGDLSCLHLAAFCGHDAVVNLLLHGKPFREFWEKRDSRYLPLLPLQVRCELLKKTSEGQFTALHMAAAGNHDRGLAVATSIVEAFMAATLEIHDFGPFNSEEIFLMINENWYQDFLLEIRDIINVHGGGGGSTKGSRHGLDMIRRGYASVTSMKQQYEGVKVYEALVDSFADLTAFVDARDCMGRTVLHYAAWHNRIPIVEFLVWDFQQNLSLGSIANLNATDLDGYTPLHLAAWQGNSRVITALLLDARERDQFGLHDPELKFVADQFTLLDLEYGENYHECNNLHPNAAAKPNGKSREIAARVELEFGSKDEDGQGIDERSLLPRPNLQAVLWQEERGGLTPMHYAVEKKHPKVVELLLSHPKIDVFGESSDGKTPWTMAFPKGRVSETWNADIPWMLRTGGKLLNRVPPLQNESQKVEVPPVYKYKRALVEKAVSLAESGSEDQLPTKMTLYTMLEVQICLSLVESFMIDNDHHDQYRFPLPSADAVVLGFDDPLAKGPSSLSPERITDKLLKWESDRNKTPWKLTLLHVTVYYGFHKELKRLVALPTFKEYLNVRERIGASTALDIAVTKCDTAAVTILLQEPTLAAAESDSDGRTPLEIAVEMQSDDLPSKDRKWSTEKWKGIEGLLKGRSDVQRYVDSLYRDRQVFVDAANAILVGAALIASVTFAGWLQPPLGYTTYQNTDDSYAAVEGHLAVRVFWAFNSLSFFSAIATVVAGAGTVLPSPGQFIKMEVRVVRRWLVFTSMLLAVAIFCVLGAFTAAGLATLPPIAKFRNNMVITSIIGLFLCMSVLIAFLHKLYLTVKLRLRSNLKWCQAYVRTVFMTAQKHK